MISGCGSGGVAPTSGTTNPTDPVPPPTTQSILVSGKVLAGSQAIAGASVQIYSSGTSGLGAGAKALLSTPVTTDTTGAFAITSGLSCSSAEPMLYLVARGGQVGSSAANSAIALAATVGDCSKLSNTTTTSFTINEVTTVAFTWSLSQFLTSDAVVGATSTNALGLANAFATAANLADTSKGTAPGASLPANGKSPAAKINTLANLLNKCITVSSACGALFSATTISGSTTPTDTLAAAFLLARNPGNNVGVLYTQAAAGAAFSPALSAAPSDWTLSITFKGGGMNGPTGVGVDSLGNVWVASFNGAASKFTPTGSPVFPNGITGNGLNASFGLALDSQNNAWIPNENSASTVNGGFGSITVLNSNGQPVSPSTGYIAGGIKFPVALAIDPNGNVWVVNYSNSRITLLSSSGTALSGATGYGAPSLAFVVSVVVDANHNAWVGNQNNEVVSRISPAISSGNASDGSQSLGVSCCSGPQGMAVDQNNYVWASNFYSDSVSQISPNGTVISPGYTGGSLTQPHAIAIDGAGSVWVASFRNAAGAANPTLVKLAGATASSPGAILSPASGLLADAGMLQPYAIAIDASGNMWITNNVTGSPVAANNSVIQLIGMAVPVKTPVIGPPQAP